MNFVIFTRACPTFPQISYTRRPATPQVEGDVKGIRFVKECGKGRGPISGDPLIYESSLRMREERNFFMLIDGRWTNIKFLQRHLKRRYDRQNKTHSFATFELLEAIIKELRNCHLAQSRPKHLPVRFHKPIVMYDFTDAEKNTET